MEILTDFLPHFLNEAFDGMTRYLLQPYSGKNKKIPRLFPVWKSVNRRKSGIGDEVRPEDIPLKPGIYGNGKYVRTIDGKIVIINLKGE